MKLNKSLYAFTTLSCGFLLLMLNTVEVSATENPSANIPAMAEETSLTDATQNHTLTQGELTEENQAFLSEDKDNFEVTEFSSSYYLANNGINSEVSQNPDSPINEVDKFGERADGISEEITADNPELVSDYSDIKDLNTESDELEAPTAEIKSSSDLYQKMPSDYINAITVYDQISLKLNDDGSFSGSWSNYAYVSVINTHYFEYSDFTGKFSTPVKTGNYSYSATVSSINYKDLHRTDPNPMYKPYFCEYTPGLSTGKDIIIIAPGAKESDIPDWVFFGNTLKYEYLKDKYLILSKGDGQTVNSIGDVYMATVTTKPTVPSTPQSKDFKYDSNGVLYEYTGASSTVNIPTGIKVIGSSVFADKTFITNVTLPSTLTAINSEAFKGCKNLKSISIPSSVKSIGDNAFYLCKNLKTVSLSYGLETIGNSAFSECGVESINIPDSVISLGGDLFSKCQSLHTLRTGNGIKEIPIGLAYACSSLKNLSMGINTERIGDSAFSRTALVSFKLPESVKYIDDCAFSQCENITTITVSSNLKKIGYCAFDGTRLLTSITLPKGLTDIDGYAFSGSGLAGTLRIPDTVTFLGNSCFCNCNSLRELVIGNSVTVIPEYMAFCCSNLEKVIVGSNVTTIKYGAFDDCIKLKEVSLPNSLSTIDDFAFAFDENLKYIRLPQKLTSIGDYAFCFIGASQLILPNNLTEIGSGAFEGANYLSKVYLPIGIKTIGVNAIDRSVELYVYEDCLVGKNYGKNNGYTVKSRGYFKPVKVFDLKASPAGQKKVKLTWTKIAGATRYMVRAKKNGVDSTLGYTTSNTITDTNAFETVENRYWVYAQCQRDGKWVNAERSDIKGAKGILPAVTNIKAQPAGINKVKISWNKVEGAVQYYIKGRKNGKEVFIGRASENRLYFVDTNALDLQDNFYWVYAMAPAGSGKRPGVKSAEVKARGVLSPVSNVRALNSIKGGFVAWDSKAGAAGYEIYRDSGSGYVKVGSVGSQVLKFYDTSANQTYRNYKVRTYYIKDGVKIYSSLSGMVRARKK